MRKVNVSQTIGIVANLGVLAGVFFLAFEIRQNTAAIQTTNLQSSLQLGNAVGSWLLDTEFANTYSQALSDLSALDDAQRLQFDEFFGQRLNIWEFAFYANESGSLSEDSWNSWNEWFASDIRQPALREYWRGEKREQYSGSVRFQAHVDSIVAER